MPMLGRRIPINRRVYIPVKIARELNLASARHVDVTLMHNGRVVTIPASVKVVRNEHGTYIYLRLHKRAMDECGVQILDYVEILGIKPRE